MEINSGEPQKRLQFEMENNKSKKLADNPQRNRCNRDMSSNNSSTVSNKQRFDIPKSRASMIKLKVHKYNRWKTKLNYAQLIKIELFEKLRTTKKQNRELVEMQKTSWFKPTSSSQTQKQIASSDRLREEPLNVSTSKSIFLFF